ncbi:Conserved_hypothetical protein [Hexamita inflata]|uniref:Tetratricopeptide repeat protein 21A/21B C-terminal ARM domain-containing protein n=1 Tax=Hexamita inflata TaxID=28002 RepID=A0AA86V102_9EUKA|nr:Conserved hypothetical protein [Hexamita inflata]
MEDFCVILSQHSLIGEIARARQLLQTPAANLLQQEARILLDACFGLALGSIQDSLQNIKSVTSYNYTQVAELIEMLYYSSLAIKETERIEVMKESIRLEAGQISSQILQIGFVACCVFDIRMFSELFEGLAQNDESVAAMLCICELLGDCNHNKFEKLYSKIHENSPLGLYATMVKAYVLLEPIKPTYSGLKMKSQLIAADQHDQMNLVDLPFGDKFTILNAINNLRAGASCSEYLKQTYQNPFNNLIMNLVLSNFPSDSEAIVAIQTYLDSLITKVIGKPVLASQKERVISILIQIARAYPTVSCLNCLITFIETYLEINKFKQIELLLAYFQGICCFFTSSVTMAKQALEHFNEVFHRAQDTQLQGIENFSLKTDDVFILVQAVLGNFEDVKSQLQDYQVDEEDEGEPLIKTMCEYLEAPSLLGQTGISKILQVLRQYEKRVNRRRFNGYSSQICDLSYGYVIPDTLAYQAACTLINELLQNKSTLDTELLTSVRGFFDGVYSVTISCKHIRYCRMLIYNTLQMFDYLLRETSDLSAFASAENNISISTTELILAASSAAQLYKHDEASTYTGQALIMDPGIEKTVEYSMVVAKILSCKGQYMEAHKKLQQVLDEKAKTTGDSYKNVDLVPLRLHMAQLKIKAGELDGMEVFKQLQIYFPVQSQVINIDMNNKNPDFLAMHVAIERSKAILYLLRLGGVFNSIGKVQAQQSSFDLLLTEHSILFFESQNLVDKFNDSLSSTFSQGSSSIGAKYIGAQYGPSPINPQSDVFYPPGELKVNETVMKFCQQNKLSIQVVVQHLKPYLQFSLDATEILSLVHLILLQDKVGYVQCFNQLIKAMPSTSRLAALASAHLSVGNAKQAQEFYGKAITTASEVIKNTKLPDYIETLIVTFLHILRSRALSRCHRYQECEKLIESLLQKQSFVPIPATADAETRMNGEAKQIVYAIVSIEYMKLMIKLRQYSTLHSLCDMILKKCVNEFNLPADTQRSGINSIPLPVVYMAVYSTRAKAELIHQNQIPLPQSERLELLNKCCFWCDSNIVIKTQRVLPAKIDLSMKMCQNVFSTQQTQISVEQFNQREQVGLRGMVMSGEIRVELAELYVDLAKIDQKFIAQQSPVVTAEKKQFLQQAYEHSKSALKIKSARALVVCATYCLLIEQNLEQARQYAIEAREIEPFNSATQQLISVISHKMNFGDDQDEESEKANTPFEDATKILKVGLNVDRVQALDNFLLNSCLVHDMTVVTEALFETEDEAKIDSEQIIGQDFTSLTELNERSDKIVASNFDGYYYLGRGFLSIKMGRIQAGFKDIMSAVNSQTLSDRYRARALYLLGSLYINPSRAPLYGFTSCLSGKQQSAVALQKQAMQNVQGDNVNYIDDQVQQVDNEDVVVPDNEVLNQRDEDLQEAQSILQTLEQLTSKNVPEAAELCEVLRGLIRVGQYQQSKDRMARILQDEGKNAKTKLQQLEMIKEESKGLMTESTEQLHERLNTIDKNAPNYIILMYALGVLYCQLKNEAKARSSFTTGAKQITSIKEVGQGQSSQAQLWLDVDASVQCNLALADQYVCIGKITNALRSLDCVAALDKIQAVSYELYGLCMEKESSYDDAVKYYESAWLLSKGSPSVAYRLAYNYMKANKYQDAILMCQAALNEWPSFMKLKKEVLYQAEKQLRTSKEAK